MNSICPIPSMNKKEYLSRNGYILRAPELNDLDLMYQFENNSALWEGNATGPYSKFLLKQYIEQNRNDLYTDHQLRLMIAHGKEVVGMIDICRFDRFHNRAEVGIVIAEAHRGKGIGHLSLQLLSEYCFGYLGIHQLYAYIDITNEASFRLFIGCGFKECAHLKDWIRSGSRYRDVKMVQLIPSACE